MTSRRDPLTLVHRFDKGDGRLSVSLDHFMAAPFRRAMKTGKPPGRWHYLILFDQHARLRVAGVLVHTPGDRLLFCPGTDTTVTNPPENLAVPRFAGQVVEHITLDPPGDFDRHRSHVTFHGMSEKDRRGLQFTTTAPPNGLAPWFTLLLPSLEHLLALPHELAITFPPPRQEVKRFIRGFGSGGVSAASVPPSVAEPSFLQLDIWAGRGDDWKEKSARVLPWACVDAIVAAPPKGSQKLTANCGTIELAPGIGVKVLVSRPQGRLDAGHILRPKIRA